MVLISVLLVLIPSFLLFPSSLFFYQSSGRESLPRPPPVSSTILFKGTIALSSVRFSGFSRRVQSYLANRCSHPGHVICAVLKPRPRAGVTKC